MWQLILLAIFTTALLAGKWFFVIMVLTWFSYRYPAWPLFIIAVLVDGYFGAFNNLPLLSLTIGSFVILVEVFKIYLLGTIDNE